MATALVEDASIQDDESWIVDTLGSIFPQYVKPILVAYVKKPRNRHVPFEKNIVLNNCIEDILSASREDDVIFEDEVYDLSVEEPRLRDTSVPSDVSILEYDPTIEDDELPRNFPKQQPTDCDVRKRKRASEGDALGWLKTGPKQTCVRDDSVQEEDLTDEEDHLPDLDRADSNVVLLETDELPDIKLPTPQRTQAADRPLEELASKKPDISGNVPPKRTKASAAAGRNTLPSADLSPKANVVVEKVPSAARAGPTEAATPPLSLPVKEIPLPVGLQPLREPLPLEEVPQPTRGVSLPSNEELQSGREKPLPVKNVPQPLMEVLLPSKDVPGPVKNKVATTIQSEAPVQQQNLNEIEEVVETVAEEGNRHDALGAAAPAPKSAEDIMKEKVNTVLMLLPDVDPEFVEATLKRFTHNDVELTCDFLLENSNYPRIKKDKPAEVMESPCADSSESQKFVPSEKYKLQSMQLLQKTFRRVSMKDLRKLTAHFNYSYTQIHNCLMETMKTSNINLNEESLNTSISNGKTGSVTSALAQSSSSPSSSQQTITTNVVLANGQGPWIFKPLKCGRSKYSVPGLGSNILPELEKEVETIKEKLRVKVEEEDRRMAEVMNEDEYESAGQLIECGCCYGDSPFESMVQCLEGHLFCQDCLRNYAKEAVYGQGKIDLECMNEGCDARFPKEQLQRALPKEMLDKYEERMIEEALNLADIEGLVRCPHCDFAAVLDPDEKVFSCLACTIETCRHCKEDWGEHFGIPCSEIEKKDETKLRLRYEEKMTLAKIRTCHKCKASFTKSEGCNKMTCRCGATMCYICRAPNIDYHHFCRHPREPGQNCNKCKDCSLWSNPEEDDERAVSEIRKEGLDEAKAQGYDSKNIGAPEEKKTKKVKPKAAERNIPVQQPRNQQAENQRIVPLQRPRPHHNVRPGQNELYHPNHPNQRVYIPQNPHEHNQQHQYQQPRIPAAQGAANQYQGYGDYNPGYPAPVAHNYGHGPNYGHHMPRNFNQQLMADMHVAHRAVFEHRRGYGNDWQAGH